MLRLPITMASSGGKEDSNCSYSLYLLLEKFHQLSFIQDNLGLLVTEVLLLAKLPPLAVDNKWYSFPAVAHLVPVFTSLYISNGIPIVENKST